MARYNDDQQEIDNMSVMNGTFSRVNNDLSANVSGLRTAISTLSQQVISLSRSAGSMAKSVADAGDLKVDTKGFVGRIAGQLGGPLGVVLSNAIIDAGIGERISNSLKNGLAGVMSRFTGRSNYSDGGFLNPASMSSISSRSTGTLVKEIHQGVTQHLVVANKISNVQLLETKRGNKGIISALGNIENTLERNRRSDYGKTHNHPQTTSANQPSSTVNNYYNNNTTSSSLDTSSIVSAINNLNSKFDEFSDPNASSSIVQTLLGKIPGIFGVAANMGWSIATFGLTKAFRGKYSGDIVRDKNPLVTIASAAIKQYEWTRLYGELTKEQLNELIRLRGGNQKKVVGRRGWLAEWMTNDPEGFEERKKELEGKGALGWLASKALGVYRTLGANWDEERWGDEVYTKADKLTKTDSKTNPLTGLFTGPFSAWKFFNANNGEKYDTVKARKKLEEDRRKLYNWDWKTDFKIEKLRKENAPTGYQASEVTKDSAERESYNPSRADGVPVIIAGATAVPGWLRARIAEVGLPTRYTRDPIDAFLALQAKQAGTLGEIEEASEVTKDAAERESKVIGGQTIQEKQLTVWEQIAQDYKEDALYRKNFFIKLGKGILGTGKNAILGSLGLVGAVASIAVSLISFATSIAVPIASLYGIYESISWLARKFGMGRNNPKSYGNEHKATTIGASAGLISGALQILKSIPVLGKFPGLGLASKVVKPFAAGAHVVDAYNRIKEGQVGRGTTQAINSILDFVPGVGWIQSAANSAGIVAGDYMEKLTGAQQAGDATSRLVTNELAPAVMKAGTRLTDKGLRYVGGKALESSGSLLNASTKVVNYAAEKTGWKIAQKAADKYASRATSKAIQLVQKGASVMGGTSGYVAKAVKVGGKIAGVGINAALYGAEAAARFAEGDKWGGAIATAGMVVGNIPIYGTLITETALAINDLVRANIALNNTLNQNDLFEAQGDTEYLKFGGGYVRSIITDTNMEPDEKAEKIANHYRKWKKDTAKADSSIRAARAANDKEFKERYKDTIKEITDSIKNDPTISKENRHYRIMTSIAQLHDNYQTNKLESAYNEEELSNIAKEAEKDQSFLNQFYKMEQVSEYTPTISSGMGYGSSFRLVDKWTLDKDSELGRLKEALANKKITQKEYNKKVALLYKQKELKQVGPTAISAKALENSGPSWKVKEESPTISEFGTFQSSTGSLLNSVFNEQVSKKAEQDNLEDAAKAQQEELIKKEKEEEEKAKKEYLERLGSASDPIVTATYTTGDKTVEAIQELTATSEKYMKEVQVNQQELAKLHTKMYGKGGETVAQAVNDSAKKMSNAVVSTSRYSTQQIINNSNRTIVTGNNQGNDNWFVPMRSTDKSFLTV